MKKFQGGYQGREDLMAPIEARLSSRSRKVEGSVEKWYRRRGAAVLGLTSRLRLVERKDRRRSLVGSRGERRRSEEGDPVVAIPTRPFPLSVCPRLLSLPTLDSPPTITPSRCPGIHLLRLRLPLELRGPWAARETKTTTVDRETAQVSIPMRRTRSSSSWTLVRSRARDFSSF